MAMLPPGKDSATRLRYRGCWAEAAVLLTESAERDPEMALLRAEILIEGCMFTRQGWADAEQAVAHAAGLANTDERSGRAAIERAYLSYAATLLANEQRAEEARSAMEAADWLFPADSPARGWLAFRRGLIAQNLDKDPKAARAAYDLAHGAAEVAGDELLLCYTSWHLGSLAAADGDKETARRHYTESLKLRESIGLAVGVAPALTALAEVSSQTEAKRLRADAARLAQLFAKP